MDGWPACYKIQNVQRLWCTEHNHYILLWLSRQNNVPITNNFTKKINKTRTNGNTNTLVQSVNTSIRKCTIGKMSKEISSLAILPIPRKFTENTSLASSDTQQLKLSNHTCTKERYNSSKLAHHYKTEHNTTAERWYLLRPQRCQCHRHNITTIQSHRHVDWRNFCDAGQIAHESLVVGGAEVLHNRSHREWEDDAAKYAKNEWECSHHSRYTFVLIRHIPATAS